MPLNSLVIFYKFDWLWLSRWDMSPITFGRKRLFTKWTISLHFYSIKKWIEAFVCRDDLKNIRPTSFCYMLSFDMFKLLPFCRKSLSTNWTIILHFYSIKKWITTFVSWWLRITYVRPVFCYMLSFDMFKLLTFCRKSLFTKWTIFCIFTASKNE